MSGEGRGLHSVADFPRSCSPQKGSWGGFALAPKRGFYSVCTLRKSEKETEKERVLKKEREKETEIERVFRFGFWFEIAIFVLIVCMWFRYFAITT